MWTDQDDFADLDADLWREAEESISHGGLLVWLVNLK